MKNPQRRLPIFLLLSFLSAGRVGAEESNGQVSIGARIRRLPPVTDSDASIEAIAPRRLPDGVVGQPLAPRAGTVYCDHQVAGASLQFATSEDQPDPEIIPAPQEIQDGLRLELFDVVDSIYATFPLLQIAFRERQIAAGRQLAARGAFDTKLEGHAIEQPLGFYQNYRQGIGATQPTWSGTDIFAGYRIGRGLFEPWFGERDTDNAGEFKAGVNIPLLRDRAIDKRRAEVLKNQLARRAVEPAIQSQLLLFVRDGSWTYWDWVSAGQSYRVAQSLLDNALDRDRAIRGRVQRGDLPEIELVDNERLVVSRRAKLIEADRKLQQAAIKLSLWLRTIDGIPRVPVVDLLPAAFPSPELPSIEILDFAVDSALAARPELAEIELARQQVSVELAEARNQMLPAVDAGLIASKDIGPLASSLGDKRPFKLEASLLADMPLQRRAARGRIQASQGKLAQLTAKRTFAADKIAVEVGNAIAALTTAMQRVQQARRSVELALRMQSAEQRKFELGDSNLLLVNIREQQTADAAQTKVDALTDFFKALADFQAATAAELSAPTSN